MKNLQIIGRIKEAYGVFTNIDLSQKMTCTDQAISEWKNRGVPKKRIEQAARETGRPVSWIMNGDQDQPLTIDRSIRDSVRDAIRQELRDIQYSIRSFNQGQTTLEMAKELKTALENDTALREMFPGLIAELERLKKTLKEEKT